MEIDAAIAASVGTTNPDDVQELVLDACKATKLDGLMPYTNLEHLTLNGCGLTSLEGLPPLPELKTLELSDNQLADGCLEALQDAALINLSRLSLAGNRFSTLEALEPLSACVNLKDLDMFNCPVTDLDTYRNGVFDMIPTLKYLDGFDVDDNEKPEDEDDEDEGEGDDDLLSSEVGEDDDDLGEDDEDGPFGDLDGEDDEDGPLGEDGEDDGEEDEAEDDPAAAPAKRQKR